MKYFVNGHCEEGKRRNKTTPRIRKPSTKKEVKLSANYP